MRRLLNVCLENYCNFTQSNAAKHGQTSKTSKAHLFYLFENLQPNAKPNYACVSRKVLTPNPTVIFGAFAMLMKIVGKTNSQLDVTVNDDIENTAITP